MGRFASTVKFYARYREPYPPLFFSKVAQQLGFCGNETLLDVGCGPGLLALGFAPFVGEVTAIDPEQAMIDAATAAASAAGVAIRFVQDTLEQFHTSASFDVVTIGRAHHWLDRDLALPVLEGCVAPPGVILICGSSNVEEPASPWVKTYDSVRRSWAEGDEKRYRIRPKDWFEGSSFSEAVVITVSQRRQVTIDELIGRALSKSNTSPQVLGDRRSEFEAALVAAVEPYAKDGVLEEEIVSRASVFQRPHPISSAKTVRR